MLVPCGDADRDFVKVSFFGSIGFGRVGEPDLTDDGVMQVASFEDLMATKVKVILQRAEVKDYIDIAAMIKAGVSLSRGMSAASLIFGVADSSSKCNSSWFFCVPHFHTEEYLMRGFITQHLSGAMIKPLYRLPHLRIRDLQQFHLFWEILP